MPQDPLAQPLQVGLFVVTRDVVHASLVHEASELVQAHLSFADVSNDAEGLGLDGVVLGGRDVLRAHDVICCCSA